jgi:hypothetical protein
MTSPSASAIFSAAESVRGAPMTDAMPIRMSSTRSTVIPLGRRADVHQI